MQRKGVSLRSGFDIALIGDGKEPGPNEYIFSRHYLIILKKRDGKEPFFTFWVDNAELMQPRQR